MLNIRLVGVARNLRSSSLISKDQILSTHIFTSSSISILNFLHEKLSSSSTIQLSPPRKIYLPQTMFTCSLQHLLKISADHATSSSMFLQSQFSSGLKSVLLFLLQTFPFNRSHPISRYSDLCLRSVTNGDRVSEF